MPTLKNPAAEMSDQAIKARTGRTWPQWFSILDKAGAKGMDHKQIVAVLDGYDIGGWWRQMVTVAYERARGLREKFQTPTGYQASRSKTMPVPLAKLYHAWSDGKVRQRWLPDANITIRKATANKSMRITWVDGNSGVEATFYSKGAGKSQVAIQHSKLPDAKAVTKGPGPAGENGGSLTGSTLPSPPAHKAPLERAT